jgi:hypothetical protein
VPAREWIEMTNKDLPNALATKLFGLAIEELRMAGLPDKDADEALVLSFERMLEWGYAIRGVNYPERLLRRGVARRSPMQA